MALNIKNPKVEALVEEVARMAGETKTEAVRRALEERRTRLGLRRLRRDRQAEVMRFLEREVWPRIPRRLLGRGVVANEQARILGYGSRGV